MQSLQTYVTHLNHLYRRNQAIMDKNNDFRNLLYNIICYLLVQDDQVIASPSVTKMIEVIRAHLESAAKYYAEATSTLGDHLAAKTEALSQVSSGRVNGLTRDNNQQVEGLVRSDSRASFVSFNGYESSASSYGGLNMATGLNTSVPAAAFSRQPFSEEYEAKVFVDRYASRQDKPADFRRVSSVSYNDEQLINYLCDNNNFTSGTGSDNETSVSGTCRHVNGSNDSPWKFDELSTECRYLNNLHASQSSLGNHSSNQTDAMNDSGHGTTFDFGVDELMVSMASAGSQRQARFRSRTPTKATGNRSTLKRHSDVGQATSGLNFDGCKFAPKQQPSYISTDEYLSRLADDSGATAKSSGLYDDTNETSGLTRINWCQSNDSLGGQLHQQHQLVDVQGRRAELEWTLNKLINLELKYAWLTSKDTLRRVIRRVGVPNEVRGKVWLILIDKMIGNKYDAAKLLNEANKTIENERKKTTYESPDSGCIDADDNELNCDSNRTAADEEIQAILKQIELDVNRTMPGHKLFDVGAEGGIKLRRILVAYSIHVNRAIAYCQGFNFIVALLLSVFEGDEERALRGFICIVDHIFPSKFYFDHYLTGARADQYLLADFICDQLIKNPTPAERKMVEGVTSSITLNWFISLFHGAVPTLTRLTILDHFMLEGVKALFKFTMAILYLAFQVTQPSSCEVFTTIRNTAKDMYDVKLLLSIVNQIKLPKDSYFAIRRSFYMIQSSFNSDQFYIQSLHNDASRQMVPHKPLTMQQLPDTKPPAMSFMSASSLIASGTGSNSKALSRSHRFKMSAGSVGRSERGPSGPRVRISSDKTKVCIQNIGRLGRSHIKIIDVNVRSNERSLMSPLRNSLVVGVSNCGKKVILARQSSRRNYKTFIEQDLTFQVHELTAEIFDGFYLEENNLVFIITHLGDMLKIDLNKIQAHNQSGSSEVLSLRDNTGQQTQARCDLGGGIGAGGSGGSGATTNIFSERLKLRQCSLDTLTKLVWIYVDCDALAPALSPVTLRAAQTTTATPPAEVFEFSPKKIASMRSKFRANNPFLADLNDNGLSSDGSSGVRYQHQRRMIIVDLITFDIFAAFDVGQQHSNGDIISMQASIVGYLQMSNPMSSQFSSRIVRVGPTGGHEHLLSFSDVVDFLISVPSRTPKQGTTTDQELNEANGLSNKRPARYSSFRNLLIRSMSMSTGEPELGAGRSAAKMGAPSVSSSTSAQMTPTTNTTINNRDRRFATTPSQPVASGQQTAGKLSRYYKTLLRAQSMTGNTLEAGQPRKYASMLAAPAAPPSVGQAHHAAQTFDPQHKNNQPSEHYYRSLMAAFIGDSNLGNPDGANEATYHPVNMAFIFRNGRIALFEFNESYSIHTRESQLDRYDYSRIIDVSKSNDDYILTILTVFDKLIKVVI